MSLNRANCGNKVLIFNGERILIFCDDVELSIEMEQGRVAEFKGNKKGRIYLTSHRTIFLSKRTGGGPSLESFAMPFGTMREVDLEQPVFGANYIKGKVVAEANGNWEGRAKFKLWFNSGGAIEFGQAMVNAAKLSARNASRMMPPSYSSPPPLVPVGATPPYSQPPPNYYAGPDSNYGWVPYSTFPVAPPVADVGMVAHAPPYPGVDPPAYSEAIQPGHSAGPAPLVPSAPSAYHEQTNGGAPNHTMYTAAPPGATQPLPPAYTAKKYD